MKSVRVGLLRKESWGGDGKMVERWWREMDHSV